jgi:predicted amidohydrolase
MDFRTSAASVATILIVFSLAHAQPASQPTIAIRAGRLIDVRTGKVSQNTFIIVAKDRVVRISDSAPAGAQTIDLSRYTVVPGLIDVLAPDAGLPRGPNIADSVDGVAAVSRRDIK